MVVAEMGETAVIRRVDPQGRVAIPADWRSEWKSDRVMLVRKGRRIELAPVEPIDPTSLFDSIVVPDDVDFSDPHSLRGAFLSSRKSAEIRRLERLSPCLSETQEGTEAEGEAR